MRPLKTFRRQWPGAVRYTRRKAAFRQAQGSQLKIRHKPILGEDGPTTAFDAHYLYQAFWASKELKEYNPAKHVDVGSDLRWIAIEQLYRPITFIDIRPPELALPNLDCKPGSVLELPFGDNSVDSLSCLHVIEHIGLGRYGDPINPQGNVEAARELARIVAPGGHLLVSTPVGQELIHYDAHRVQDPVRLAEAFSGCRLQSFSAVNDAGKFIADADIHATAREKYACGMFHFRKD